MALAEQARDAALRVHDYREAIRDQYNAWSYLMCCRADHPDEVDRVAERLAELESRTRERRGQPLLPDGHTTLTPYYYLRGQWDQPGTRPPEVKLGPGSEVDWLFKARFALVRGDLEAARAAMDEIRPNSPDGKPPLPHNLFHFMRIHICLAGGDLEGARQWHEAIQRWTAEPTMRGNWDVLLAAAEFHRADGQAQKAWEVASWWPRASPTRRWAPGSSSRRAR